ncbi:MAG: VCBS repeat-containing protein [Thermoguttaceae bacterium]|nr:VCBS repeat-containing protein [Thermoguttaceae bacterium]MDW8078313.1 VCBS repeat-containing protein [Thermoguttaceae bacterium]
MIRVQPQAQRAIRLIVNTTLAVVWLAVCAPVLAEVTLVRWRHLSSTRGEVPVPVTGNEQTACLVADLDGDKLQDIVIAERTKAPSLVWLRLRAGSWERLAVDDNPLPIEAGGACGDINGDGRLDLVFGGDWRSNQVWWWENPGPPFDRPWRRFVIKASGGNQHHDQIFGDFTKDGRPEVIFWNQRARTLFLAEIPPDVYRPENWELRAIWTWQQGSHEGLARADINGDGDLDLVGGGYWFEYLGEGKFRPHKIDDYGTSRSAAGDLNGDGRVDVVLNSGDGIGPLTVYFNRGGEWEKNILEAKIDHGHTLEIADLNADGALDIYAAEMHTPGPKDKCRQLIFYGNGQGEFQPQVISVGICNHESRVGDVNGDGRLDIIGKPYTWSAPRVDIWLNEGSQ